MNDLLGPIIENVVAGLLGSAIVFAGGFLVGRYRERRRARGRNLEDYDFYPFAVDRDNFPQFDLGDFRRGVTHFLQNSDATAARQLIFIGEQNEVRHQLDRDALSNYERLYAAYGGERIVEENNEFLENYKRIVRLIGRTFRDMGIEVLLHNLSNPAKSICAIEGGDVTGRALELGTTSLVIDLKKRRLLNQDKLNYELNIGARRFKCTTIPIYRREFGLVAALCVNIDINYIRDDVQIIARGRIEEFLAKYARTEMQLEENILSREEYAQAINGKRHWRDEPRAHGPAGLTDRPRGARMSGRKTDWDVIVAAPACSAPGPRGNCNGGDDGCCWSTARVPPTRARRRAANRGSRERSTASTRCTRAWRETPSRRGAGCPGAQGCRCCTLPAC